MLVVVAAAAENFVVVVPHCKLDTKAVRRQWPRPLQHPVVVVVGTLTWSVAAHVAAAHVAAVVALSAGTARIHTEWRPIDWHTNPHYYSLVVVVVVVAVHEAACTRRCGSTSLPVVVAVVAVVAVEIGVLHQCQQHRSRVHGTDSVLVVVVAAAVFVVDWCHTIVGNAPHMRIHHHRLPSEWCVVVAVVVVAENKNNWDCCIQRRRTFVVDVVVVAAPRVQIA